MTAMNEIIKKHNELDRKLRFALSTMERKSVIFDIKKELIELQQICPHYSEEHNFTMAEGECPYCGKQLEVVRNDKGY